MFFWHNWHKVTDPCTADDWTWVNNIMGPRGLIVGCTLSTAIILNMLVMLAYLG